MNEYQQKKLKLLQLQLEHERESENRRQSQKQARAAEESKHHADQLQLQERELESKERIAERQIESNEGMFRAMQDQSERHFQHRVARERDENAKNRNLMTYNVHVDNWTRQCMVPCFGSMARWGMSSEHIVQAAELNRNASATNEDMLRFVDAIAAGSTLIRLANGSTKIMLDHDLLPLLEQVAERRPVALSHEDRQDMDERLLHPCASAGTQTGEGNDGNDECNSDGTDSVASAAEGRNKQDDDSVTPETAEEGEEQAQTDAADNEDDVEEYVEERDDYADINPNASQYVHELFKKVADTMRSAGEVKHSMMVCAFTNVDSMENILRGEKNVIARLVKWRRHCKEELLTRSSIRSKTEVMRDERNARTDRRKTMIKDLTQLMKHANHFNASTGKFNCFICSKVMHIDDYDVERLHVVSKADGGDCSATNLVPGCFKCNRSSGRVNPIDIREN